MEEIASMSINKLPSKNSTSLNGRAQEITESIYAEEQLVKVDVDKERRRTHFTDWVQEEVINGKFLHYVLFLLAYYPNGETRC